MSTLTEDTVSTEVDLAMPQGDFYQMPDEWVDKLRSIEQRSESPSSFRSYKACPLRWYIERYAGLEGSPSGFPAVMGSFVHRVLEVFYSEPAHLRDKDLLLRVFRTSWDAIKQGSKIGIIDARLQEEFDILEANDPNPDSMRGRFYNRAQSSVLAIEEFDEDMSEVDVKANETWVNMKVNGIKINGRVDRIIRNPTRGGEVIQDYKTGRCPPDDEPISVLSDSFMAMGMYALMRSKAPDTNGPVTRVDLLYLSKGEEYKLNVTPKLLATTTELVDKITSSMNRVVETGEIMCSPGETPDDGPCSWCPVKGMCPAWTDGTFASILDEPEI